MLKHPKRPQDPIALAVRIGRSEMAERGRKGGELGGNARASAMAAEQRSAGADKAARARWDK